MPKMLTNAEMPALLRFLAGLADHQSNAGCNDYTMPDTPSNREMMRAAIADSDYPGNEIETYKGQIQTSDFILLGYLTRKLINESGLMEEPDGN